MELRVPKWVVIAGGLVAVVVIAGAVTLLVRGGNEDEESAVSAESTTESEVTAGGAGTYTVADPVSGAEISLTIPAPESSPQLKEWEEHVAALDFGLPEPLLGKVAIDNRQGFAKFELEPPDAFTLATDRGKQVALAPVERLPGCTERPNQCSDELYSADIDIYNDYIDKRKAVPGAKATTLAYTASNERPIAGVAAEDIARVFLLSYGEPVEMLKPGQDATASASEDTDAACPPGYVPVGTEGACAPAD